MRVKHVATGHVFSAPTAEDVVRLMWKSEWFKRKNVHKHMVSIARRYEVWAGSAIRTTNARKFIDDLIRTGWLIEEDRKCPRAW